MMKRIAIIANQALAGRLFLRTPIFDILRSDPDNFINIYTPAKRLKKEFKFKNIRVRGCKFLFGLKDSDVIILPEWHTDASREILQKADRWKIPTFFVQPGPANPSGGYRTDLYPTKICVWGEAARRIYIQRGIDPGRIVVTGSPRFDLYYQFKSQRLFSGDKKILLFATQALWQSPAHHPNARDVIARQVDIMHQACRDLGLQLVCKLHPSDDPGLYKKEGVIVLEDTGVSSKNYIKGYCSTGYDPDVSDLKKLGDILFSSDVVTTIFSTAGLEAMILGKPVIFFDSTGYHKKFEANRIFIEKCSFALASDKEGFYGLLQRYLKDPDADSEKRKEVVFDFAYKQDGQASQRVVRAVEEILGR